MWTLGQNIKTDIYGDKHLPSTDAVIPSPAKIKLQNSRKRKVFISSNKQKSSFKSILFGALLILASIITLYFTDTHQKIGNYFIGSIQNVIEISGFTIDKVEVYGRKQANQVELYNQIQNLEGAAFYNIDINKIKLNLEKIDWVKKASVEVLLPNKLVIKIEEKVPSAIWNMNGKFSLIDNDGNIITNNATQIKSYNNLPLVIGNGAEKHFNDLVQAVIKYPSFSKYVHAASRMGNRRWDLILASGIKLMLPEQNYDQAIQKLLKINKNQNIINRADLTTIDMRLEDRITLKIKNELITKDNNN